MSTLRHPNIVQFLGVCVVLSRLATARASDRPLHRDEAKEEEDQEQVYLVTHHGLGQFHNNGSVKYFLTTLPPSVSIALSPSLPQSVYIALGSRVRRLSSSVSE